MLSLEGGGAIRGGRPLTRPRFGLHRQRLHALHAQWAGWPAAWSAVCLLFSRYCFRLRNFLHFAALGL